MSDTSRTKPSRGTRAEEEKDARVSAGAQSVPPDSDGDSTATAQSDPEVAEHYEEMIERGANQRGEGRLP